mmetsp:Transcript_17492/g.44815  ORF Transcript_17492/g.44815 Transcript_17492/m.44815 type:complete len:201 (+) Transcript_17492:42-644(+)
MTPGTRPARRPSRSFVLRLFRTRAPGPHAYGYTMVYRIPELHKSFAARRGSCKSSFAPWQLRAQVPGVELEVQTGQRTRAIGATVLRWAGTLSSFGGYGTRGWAQLSSLLRSAMLEGCPITLMLRHMLRHLCKGISAAHAAPTRMKRSPGAGTTRAANCYCWHPRHPRPPAAPQRASPTHRTGRRPRLAPAGSSQAASVR